VSALDDGEDNTETRGAIQDKGVKTPWKVLSISWLIQNIIMTHGEGNTKKKKLVIICDKLSYNM
jgi:hypothetical protein